MQYSSSATVLSDIVLDLAIGNVHLYFKQPWIQHTALEDTGAAENKHGFNHGQSTLTINIALPHSKVCIANFDIEDRTLILHKLK